MATNERFWRTCKWCDEQVASGNHLGVAGTPHGWFTKNTAGGVTQFCSTLFGRTGDAERALHEPYDLKPESMPLEEWLDA